jgi:hypothetical protein
MGPQFFTVSSEVNISIHVIFYQRYLHVPSNLGRKDMGGFQQRETDNVLWEYDDRMGCINWNDNNIKLDLLIQPK